MNVNIENSYNDKEKDALIIKQQEIIDNLKHQLELTKKINQLFKGKLK